MHKTNDSLLRRALLGNAAFSTLSGLVLLAAAGPLERLTGLGPRWLLMAIGAGLLLFAVGLVADARRRPLGRRRAGVTIAMDFGWVAGSAVLLVVGGLSSAGWWTVALVAEIVLALALLQTYGLRRAT